jgi:hypothetical protein
LVVTLGVKVMRRTILILLVALIGAVPSTASAALITAGVWSPAGTAAADGGQFWDNTSVDDDPVIPPGFLYNAGALLQRLHGPLEYLHTNGSDTAVGFAFDEPIPSFSEVATLTTWSGGLFNQEADGSFTYNANQVLAPGHISNSLTHPGQFVLFRKVVPGATQYFIAVEDIRFDLQAPPNIVSDEDFNDYIVTFRIPTQQAPEPALLLLMGTGLMFAGRRLRRQA